MPLIMPYNALKAVRSNDDPTRGLFCVYKYYIPQEYLYIGQTTIGIIARNRQHIATDTFMHYLRAFDIKEDTITVIIHRCNSRAIMQYFEKKLIRAYQPRCNIYFRSAIPNARRIFYVKRGVGVS